MVGTTTKIDYRLRPQKHAERTMLIDLFRRLRFAPIESYRYVGFGAIAFVDFKMVHRALAIKNMVSIEDTSDPLEQRRFRRNKPIGNIDLRFGNSAAVLPAIDFGKRSIVWLDYDNALSRSMANDLETIAVDAASGTFVAVTVTAAAPRNGEEGAAARLARYTQEFPDHVGEIKPIDIENGAKHAKFIRATLDNLLDQAVKDADAGKSVMDRRDVYQVCFFRYRDGIPMMTVGWVIVARRDATTFADCRFDALHFYRPADESFDIRMPLVTPYEIRELERRLPDVAGPKTLLWIPQEERAAFQEMHLYMPSFGNVEAI